MISLRYRMLKLQRRMLSVVKQHNEIMDDYKEQVAELVLLCDHPSESIDRFCGKDGHICLDCLGMVTCDRYPHRHHNRDGTMICSDLKEHYRWTFHDELILMGNVCACFKF